MVLKGILLAVCCSSASLIIHLLISLFRKGRNRKEPLILELIRQTRLSLAIWIGTFLFYAVLFLLPVYRIDALLGRLNAMDHMLGFVYGAILYLFLSFAYLTFYYMADRSVSATILEIIDNAAQKSLKAEDIKRIYGTEKKYLSELNGMAAGGFIIEEAGYYKNSLKGDIYALLVRAVKAVLRLGPGG